MPRVFLLNDGGHNYDAAHAYTDEPFVSVTSGRPNIFNVGELTVGVSQTLASFTSSDYLLLSGSPVLAAIAMAVLKDTYDHKTINVLIFHANSDEYVARRIDGFVASQP